MEIKAYIYRQYIFVPVTIKAFANMPIQFSIDDVYLFLSQSKLSPTGPFNFQPIIYLFLLLKTNANPIF